MFKKVPAAFMQRPARSQAANQHQHHYQSHYHHHHSYMESVEITRLPGRYL